MIDVELVPEAARVVGIEIEGSMVSQHGLEGQIHGWMAAGHARCIQTQSHKPMMC